MFNLLNPILTNNKKLSEWTDNDLFYKYLETQKVYYFDIIYKRLSKKIFAKCMSFLKSEAAANDAVQDIFVTVILKGSKFKGKSKLSTWIYTITYNHCVDIIRKRKKEKKVLVDDWSRYEQLDEVEDYLILETKIEKLKIILDQLPSKDKMILLMKYQDSMSVNEISLGIGKSVSAVKMMINRAKHKFRDLHKLLEDKNYN